MRDYNKLTYIEATADTQQLYADLKRLYPRYADNQFSASCNSDKAFAYKALSTERKYFIKAGACIIDYERGNVPIMFENTIDEDIERFIGTPHEDSIEIVPTKEVKQIRKRK